MVICGFGVSFARRWPTHIEKYAAPSLRVRHFDARQFVTFPWLRYVISIRPSLSINSGEFMNKKLFVVSALPLMLSITFVDVVHAADLPINATLSGDTAVTSPVSEPSLTDSQRDASKLDADKGGETKKMLGEVVVTGKHEAADTTQDLSAETEGSGSYNGNAVTIAGKVPMKRKEIANSVSVVTRKQMDDQNFWICRNVLPLC
jgi:hypothetical protein